jgi:cytoskeletal protein RodZ
MIGIVKNKDKLTKNPESDNSSSIKEKEHSEINSQSEKIQSVALSSSTIRNIQGSRPMKPNALTMTERINDSDKNQKMKRKKVGDGAFIAAEDR